MENFTYVAPTKYIFGKDAELNIGAEARAAGMSRVLVVVGQGHAIRSGLLDRVLEALHNAGIGTEVLSGIQPNPLDGPVYKGIDLVRAQKLDGVIAVGGGSVIDTAKAIAAGAEYDGDFWDFYCGKAVIAKALPIGVVLTIPAAGSEGSGNSVITKEDGMRKISLRTDYWLRPRFAMLNPSLTMTLPPYQTFAGVVDMMAHIFERYFTPTENTEVTDRLAEGLLRAIISQALVLVEHPDNYDARANIMWAATQAHNGLCGCGRIEDWASHGMEHELSALYGVTHGAGLAVVNPAWMTFMTDVKPERIAQMAERVFDVSASEYPDIRARAHEGIRRLRSFYRAIGMPTTLGELGISNPDFDTLVRKLHENKGQTFGGYYPITPEISPVIYRLML